MTEVRLSDEDSLERALKLFKRKLQKSGLFGELRRRRHYVKPSEARAIKSAAAIRRFDSILEPITPYACMPRPLPEMRLRPPGKAPPIVE